jgi:GPH family glycoside/pentoside/hexuronide:cation symporter
MEELKLKDPNRMRIYEYAGYAAGNTAYTLQTMVIASYMLMFWTTSAGIPAMAVGVMMLVCRIVDAFTDIGFGLVADRTHTRMGSFKPWYLIHIIPMCVFFVLMFFVPGSIKANTSSAIAYMYIVYLLYGSVFATISYTAIGAFTSVQTANPKERRFMVIARQWSSSVAGVLSSLLAMPMILRFGKFDTTSAEGYLGMSLVMGVITLALFIFSGITVKERVPLNPGKKVPLKDSIKTFRGNYLAWGALVVNLCLLMMATLGSGFTSYYYVYYKGDPTAIATVMTIAGVFGMIFNTIVTPIIINKMERKRSYILTVIVIIIAYVITYLCKGQLIWLIVGQCMFQSMIQLASSFVYRVIPDAVDYGEWKSGVSAPGAINTAISFIQKVGMGVGTFIITAVLTLVGFNATVMVQSPATAEGIRAAYSIMPIICMLVSLIGVALVKKVSAEKMAQVRQELMERRGIVVTEENKELLSEV